MYINFSHKEFADRFSIHDVETFCGMFYANAKRPLFDFARIVSLSFKLGFDRKIYLHIITEESGVFT
jgi:hypothetical protein